jgi:hypothetical protein
MVCTEMKTWKICDRHPNRDEVIMITACLELVFKRVDGQ